MKSTRKFPKIPLSRFALFTLFALALVCAACNYPPPTPTELPLPAEETLPPAEAVPTDVPAGEVEPPAPAAELIPVDDTWNRYINYALGFEMLVPTTMVHGHAGCYWNDADGDHSYRPLAGMVPVMIVEAGDTVYITSETYSVLLDETVEDGRHFYAGCELVENNLELLQNREFPNIFWEIVSRPVASEDDLLSLVHDVYGEACGLGEITPVEGQDYSSVAVLSDGLPMEQSQCVLNYAYRFYYQPESGRAVTWALGQAATFFADVDYMEAPYDTEMLESFQFVTE